MPLTFPSPEWVAELEKQINASAAFRASGLTWEAGAIALVGDREPELGFDEDIAIWLDLYHGECRQAKLVPMAEAYDSPRCALPLPSRTDPGKSPPHPVR